MSAACKQDRRLGDLGGCMEDPNAVGRCMYCDGDFLPGATAYERLEAMVRQLSRPWWRAAA